MVVRVLHVLGELRPSGAETMLLGSAAALMADGITTAVVATGAKEGVLAAAFRERGVDVVHLPFSGSLRYVVALARLGRRYDVVHVHTERASFWVCAALRVAGVPVMRTVHSAFLFEGRLRRVRGAQRRLMRRAGVSFIAIGREVCDNEWQRFRLRTDVVPNWADERFAIADGRTYASEPTLILTIGNCGEPKNHPALIEAVGALLRRGMEVRYRHVGAQDQSVVDERHLARESGCADAVDFVGPDDPLRHLREADLFVMPSVREGFGLAALEALTAGVPCVLADAPGLREFRDVPGVWWAEPDTEGLTSTIAEALATSSEERHRRATQAAQHVAANFSAPVSRGLLVACYRRMSAGRRRSLP